MDQAASTPYDDIPYGNFAFPTTHPDRLATVAWLFGMEPAPVDGCRVLELGCASGGNLIPMAEQLPDSEFLGIDRSGRQIAEGRDMIQALGLTNIELRQLDILDIGAGLGTFDYIIAHGLFSWVAPKVQEKVLSICRTHLAPQGAAFISYNTYPGWHLRGMVREMMLFSARRFRDPQLRIHEARGWIDYLVQATAEQNNAFSLLLKEELELLRARPDWYLLHDHMEQINAPLYFEQFVERAALHELQYLGEAELHAMAAAKWTAELEYSMRRQSMSLLDMEQIQDFVNNRTFRQTIVCHARVPLNRWAGPEAVTRLFVSSSAKPVVADSDTANADGELFRDDEGHTVRTGEALLQAAMRYLAGAWPRPVPFDSLLAAARACLPEKTRDEPDALPRDRGALAHFLLHGATLSPVVELHSHAPRVRLDVCERPTASPVARRQAAAGREVTNLRHQPVSLSETSRQVLRHLDGGHDRAALLDMMDNLIQQGKLTAQENGETLPNEKRLRELMPAVLDQVLEKISKDALLIG
jgi:methyltransferase-like protein/SAM-dependent methyltransferase